MRSDLAEAVNVWPAPSAIGLSILPSGLRQRIRPRSELPAKMEIRATFLGDEDLVHLDHAGDRRAQAELALDLRGGEALDLAAVGVGLGPDDEDLGDGRVGDPVLGPESA